MTPSHRCYRIAITILVVSVLSGCLARRAEQQFSMSFLPAAIPAPVVTEETSPPAPSLYMSSMPNLAQRTLPQIDWPTEVDSRVLSADHRFEAAKKLYQRGDLGGARREFNLAIDLLLTVPDNVPASSKLERKLDQLVETIYRYDLEGLGSGEGQDKVVFDKSPIDGILEMTFPVDPNLKPKVLEEVRATVSQLPLETNDSVLGYIHFFSSDRGRKTILAGLRHAGRYKPLIQRILDEEGVPQELIYLAQAESGFMPRAVSNKKAEGMWQFVQFRGRQYGLLQTPNNDDRLDPEKATRAAARHLRDLYNHFGDWYLAMAAYNCGPGCVDSAVMRTGYADFWELRNRNALPRETQNYVPAILAITIMAKNQKDYGLEDIDLDQPIEYDTLDLKAATNIGLVADAVDRPASEIRDLNPGLLRAVAPAGYQLHIPKGTSNAVLAALENVPPDRRLTWRMHRVERGETLAQIAKQFATPANSIAQANNRLEEAPEAGDLLIIPASYTPAGPPVRHAASKKAPARYRSVSRTTRKNVATRPVPDRILQHRASPRTVKTAAVRVPSDSE
jgi:membrane-bound lytic murein transglycosylase D